MDAGQFRLHVRAPSGTRIEETERVFGQVENEIRETVPGWTVWTHSTPGGETLQHAGERADRVIARALAAGGDVALFSHGHFLRILAARWLELPPERGRSFLLETATLSELGFERDTHVLARWNA